MKISKRILIILNCFFVLNFNAQKIIDTIAVKAGVYDIPIKIKLPKNTIGKSRYGVGKTLGAFAGWCLRCRLCADQRHRAG